MSTRGFNLLDRWIGNNLPETAKADTVSISEHTHNCMPTLRRWGSGAKRSTKKLTAYIERLSMLWRTLILA